MERNIIKDKIEIKLSIELLTGMHIGGNEGIATIGAVDSVVIRDPLTRKTMIPGSSLKGKMRNLLMRSEGTISDDLGDNLKLARLFGSKKVEEYARLQFADSLLADDSAKKLQDANLDLQYSEIKFENKINPVTLVANPRQIERAVRGSVFDASLVYTVSNEDEVIEDFETINKGIVLLENDYIGGSGSRGYGRVKIEVKDITAKNVNKDVKLKVDIEELKNILNKR